eukprot:2452482-Alexandrium_andersonii.AAC.1
MDWRPRREIDPQKGSYLGPNIPAKLAPLNETAKASILPSKLIRQSMGARAGGARARARGGRGGGAEGRGSHCDGGAHGGAGRGPPQAPAAARA